MISLLSMLKNIDEKPPVMIPNSFRIFPKSGSLIEAMKAMKPSDIRNWEKEDDSIYYDLPWTQKFQGFTHDNSHWYISNWSYIRKCSPNFDIIYEVGIPFQGYDHFGDMDFYDGLLYVPLQDTDLKKTPMVIVYDSSLNYIKSAELTKNNQNHAGWCAINPWDGYLYTSEWPKITKLYIYDPNDLYIYDRNDPSQAFRNKGTFELHDPDGSLDRVQGGCFSDNGRLYLSLHGTQDIRCYSVLNGHFMGRLESPYDSGRRKQFEMEGITIWKNVGIHPGHVHVAILDKDRPRRWTRDDLYIRNYRSNSPETI